MHNPPFKMLKELILTKTESLFQDDTGIPYRDFKKKLEVNWQLYGEYAKPVKDFGDEKFQPDLDSLYKASKDKQEIPFSLGYHWGSKKQNYMLVKKIPLQQNFKFPASQGFSMVFNQIAILFYLASSVPATDF